MKMKRKLMDVRDEGLFKGQLGCGSKEMKVPMDLCEMDAGSARI